MSRSLGDMIDLFLKTYGLVSAEKLDIRHEGVHAMSGIGIGGMEEIRIQCLVKGIEGASLDKTTHLAKDTFLFLSEYYRGYRKANAIPGAFETDFFQLAHRHITPLDPREIEGLHSIGKKLGTDFKKISGREYFDLTFSVNHIPFSQVDISRHVETLRRHFETAKNRRVARLARNMLEQQALKKTGQSRIPPYGVPWTSF